MVDLEKRYFFGSTFLSLLCWTKKIKPTVIKQSMCWYIVDSFISEHCTDQLKTSGGWRILKMLLHDTHKEFMFGGVAFFSVYLNTKRFLVYKLSNISYILWEVRYILHEVSYILYEVGYILCEVSFTTLWG